MSAGCTAGPVGDIVETAFDKWRQRKTVLINKW